MKSIRMRAVLQTVTSEAAKGLGRLRNAAILSAVASLLSIPLLTVLPIFIELLSALIGEVPKIPADIPLGTLIAAIALAAIAGLLMLVAWIFRVIGWWNMRKSGWRRRFYTVVWLAVIIDLATFLLSDLILVAALITAIVGTIEGVASLDVGLLTKTKLLSAGSVVYVAAAFLGVLSGPALLRGNVTPWSSQPLRWA